MHEEFILLEDYESTIMVLEDLEDAKKLDYINVSNYLFGNTTFNKIIDSFNKIRFYHKKIYEQIIDREIKDVFTSQIQNKVIELKESILNETIS